MTTFRTYKAATENIFTRPQLLQLKNTSIGKKVYFGFMLDTEPLGEVVDAWIQSEQIEDGTYMDVLYVQTKNIKAEGYWCMVPGFKHPDYNVTHFGLIQYPADNQIKPQKFNKGE